MSFQVCRTEAGGILNAASPQWEIKGRHTMLARMEKYEWNIYQAVYHSHRAHCFIILSNNITSTVFCVSKHYQAQKPPPPKDTTLTEKSTSALPKEDVTACSPLGNLLQLFLKWCKMFLLVVIPVSERFSSCPHGPFPCGCNRLPPWRISAFIRFFLSCGSWGGKTGSLPRLKPPPGRSAPVPP